MRLCNYFSVDFIDLNPIFGDAGFRCYYRFVNNKQSFIAVDAPPEKSNNDAFVFLQKALTQKGLKVPEIVAWDKAQGFLCLEDFGDVLFFDAIAKIPESEEEQALYIKAIKLLPLISSIEVNGDYSLPEYDCIFFETELAIFSEWFLNKHLSIYLTEDEKHQLAKCFKFIVNSALEQPKVFVHRDYHSRNLMMLADAELGIIDFQDAVSGPITYDIASLLKDCYKRLSVKNVNLLFNHFCKITAKQYHLENISEKQWQRWFDLMGLQRHIKVAGIFSRLYYRDDKASYIKDIPLVLHYILDVSACYPELSYLHQLIEHKVMPIMKTLTDINETID